MRSAIGGVPARPPSDRSVVPGQRWLGVPRRRCWRRGWSANTPTP